MRISSVLFAKKQQKKDKYFIWQKETIPKEKKQKNPKKRGLNPLKKVPVRKKSRVDPRGVEPLS
jgi:hypothetical protein